MKPYLIVYICLCFTILIVYYFIRNFKRKQHKQSHRYDYYKAINEIKETLIENGYSQYSDEIAKRVRSGSTGGEILDSVGFYIKHLDELSPDAYKLIRKKTKTFVKEVERTGTTKLA